MDKHPGMNDEAYAHLVEESAEELYQNAPCGYISTLPNGTIIKVNQTFLSWTGYRREELLSKRFQDLLSMGGKIFHETHYAPLLRMQGFVTEVNFDILHKDGVPRPMLLSTTQKRDASGKPVLNRTTLFNMTDRKKYERELLLARQRAEQATEDKANFLSTVSHEIRTPMNAIIGISNLLQETELAPDQQKYVRILKDSSEGLLSLINDILDFSKIEAGKVGLEDRSFNIHELVYRIFYGLNVKAEEKGLSVKIDIDERVPAWLRGDPVKLGQVLTNLMGNAIKFTERGSVTLSVKAREVFPDAVSLDFKVSDTGIGIPPDRLNRIFEGFTQASYDIGMKYGGTGLGLAISLKLLELHGSKMNVESVLGEGSTFSFKLRMPLGREQETSRGLAESLPDTQSLRGLKILVAEDNAINVFVLAQFLRKWGVEFEVAENGQRAVEKVQEREFDLVLMDLQMPELDGYGATQTLRELPDERFRRLPIIALTASTSLGEDERATLIGFTDYLGKPFKPEALFSKLALHGARQGLTRIPGEAHAQAQGLALPDGTLPRFDLAGLRELAGDDAQALVELGTIAIQTHAEYQQVFQQVLESGTQEDFAFQHHKIKPTLDLFQAHGLRQALEQAKPLVGGRERDLEKVTAAIQAIQDELEALIQALEQEVQSAQAPRVPAPLSVHPCAPTSAPH
jgi:PAS domain S-box-containing protein